MPVLHAAEPTLPEGRLAVLYDKNKMVRTLVPEWRGRVAEQTQVLSA